MMLLLLVSSKEWELDHGKIMIIAYLVVCSSSA